ncbi:MAG TPA: hypothetical protein VLQ93_00045 [Myxococcaceae bacterium]|nr:hypothetical protein [Myxococcaceae bacterium]
MNTRVVWTTVAGALLSLTVGCASGTKSARAEEPSEAPAAEATATRPQGMEQQMDAQVCPMRVPETQVSVSDTPSGVALTFTTQDEASVEELRQRLRRMAEMHNLHHGPAAEGVGGGGMGGRGMRGGQGGAGMRGGMRMIPSTATVEETEGGARLVLTPADPAQLEELRAQVRQHAERMRQGGCPMMMMMGMDGTTDSEHAPQESQ